MWRDQKGGGGRYLQSIHFGFALGGFIGPILAEPFLSIRQDPESNGFLSNNTEILSTNNQESRQSLSILHLYPMLGCISFVISLAYMACEILTKIHLKNAVVSKNTSSDKPLSEKLNENFSEPKAENGPNYSCCTWIFLCTMLVFFILYVGVEASLNSLMPVFSVKSTLRLSQQEGTAITSLFWATFAAMRLLYIFVPKRITCVQGLCFSLFVIGIGTIGLSISSEYSKYHVSVFSAFVAIGCAPLFGNFVMFLERYVEVNGKINALIIVCGSIGGSVFPTIVGQIVSNSPMFLMYIELGLSALLMTLFIISFWIGRKITNERLALIV